MNGAKYYKRGFIAHRIKSLVRMMIGARGIRPAALYIGLSSWQHVLYVVKCKIAPILEIEDCIKRKSGTSP